MNFEDKHRFGQNMQMPRKILKIPPYFFKKTKERIFFEKLIVIASEQYY